jgi:hypothetical protein
VDNSALHRDFSITFDESLSPRQVAAILEALADYYRQRGGAGFEIDFQIQELLVREPVHA